jgi:hypothetical protein
MPIITEQYSNPQWGFMHGFNGDGAVPPSDQFTGWKSLDDKRKAQASFREAMLAADDAVQAAARDMPGVFDSLATLGFTPLWAVNLLARDTQARIKQQVGDVLAQWNLAMKSAYIPMSAQGVIGEGADLRSATPDDMKKLLNIMSRQVTTVQDAVQLSNETTNKHLLLTAVAKTVGEIIELFNKFFQASKNAAGAIADIAGTISGWLPVIVVAAIVIPFGINAYLKYKEGGTDAALRYTSESIKSGREAAADAARKAAAAAKKAAAAYASGGASLALQGNRRSRMARRRRR